MKDNLFYNFFWYFNSYSNNWKWLWFGKKYCVFVFKLLRQIYGENKEDIGGIIIIVGEFQVVKGLGNYLDSFFMEFWGYVTEQRIVVYILSGLMGLQDNLISDIAGQNGVFGGRLLTINIGPFFLWNYWELS